MEKKTMYDYVLEANTLALKYMQSPSMLVEPLLNEIKDEMNTLWLVASGSSYNACQCAKPMMEKCFEKDIKVVTPYTFTHYEHNIQPQDTVLVISQSGFSTNAIEAIQKVKELGHKTIAITGNVNSDIKDYADVTIDYGVGVEVVGYVTKGVTILTLFLQLLSIQMTQKTEYITSIQQALLAQKAMITWSCDFIQEHYKALSSMSQCYFVGAYSSYGVALEGALKLGETVHIPTNTYEVEEYIHGPNLQLTPKYTVILFDNGDKTSQRVNQVYEATKQVTDHTFLIKVGKASEDRCILNCDFNIEIACLPFVYLPFVQLLSHYISRDLKTIHQHPLLKEFKKIASAKTTNFINQDND